jgi:hypothetical protein
MKLEEMFEIQPITKRSSKSIKADLDQLAKEVGKDEILKVMAIMDLDRELYHIKDFYEGMISFIYYRRQKRVDDYLTKLIKQYKL